MYYKIYTQKFVPALTFALFGLFLTPHLCTQNIKQELYALQEEARIALEIAFPIPAAEWQRCLDHIGQLRHYLFTHYYTQPHQGVKYSQELPQEIIEHIQSLLHSCGIHPQSVALHSAPAVTEVHPSGIAYSKAPVLIINTHHQTIQINEVVEPACIVLVIPQLIEAFYNDRNYFDWILLHEITHLLENHSWQQTLVENILIPYVSGSLTELPEWNNYLRSHELQADLFPCINNPQLTMYALQQTQERAANYMEEKYETFTFHPHPPELLAWLEKMK